MKKILFLVTSLVVAAHISVAQTWSLTGAPITNSWDCIASSADGSRLIAGVWGGSIYLSTNSGTTWTPAQVPNDIWGSVASSANGTKLLAASTGGWVLTSADAGTTWVTNNLPQYYWSSAASSADGNTLAVVSAISGFPQGIIFVSTNAGMAWTSNQLSVATSVAMSADGTKIVVVGPPRVWRSTNSGTSWVQLTNAPTLWTWVTPAQYIASSANGEKLLYAVSYGSNYTPGLVYISTNSGDSWNPTSSTSNLWDYVACSADGNTLLAASYSSPFPDSIYLSTNCGATSTANSSPPLAWWMVAASSDGGKLFAADEGDANSDGNSGSIYTLQSVRPPCVGIAPNQGDVLISWLVPSTNFVLQESSDLASWSAVTNTPKLNMNNLQDEVSLPSSNNTSFYRLRTP